MVNLLCAKIYAKYFRDGLPISTIRNLKLKKVKCPKFHRQVVKDLLDLFQSLCSRNQSDNTEA